MTINIADNNPRVSYSVSAGVTQTSFAVPFEFFDETDVLVYIGSTLQTLNTDYTISGGDGTTGTITMSVTGPATVALVRDVTIERSTDFPTAGPFSVQSLNVELDKQIAIDADLEDQIDRAVRSPIEEFTTMTLPDAATRADKILKFDTDGNVAVESASALAAGAVVGANFVNNTFTGDGSQTAFTTTVEAGSKNNAQVYIDGVYQLKSSFSMSGLTLTFTEAPPLNSQIEVIIGNAIDTVDADSGNVNYNQGSTGAQTRTVENKLQEFVSVKDFGAIGDGVTDDTAAIQACFNSAAASKLKVYIPSGTYMINAHTIQAGQAKHGLYVPSNSHIIMDNGTTLKAIPNASDLYNVLLIYNVQNVKIENGTLAGDRATHVDTGSYNGIGMRIQGATDVYIYNVTSKDMYTDGFAIVYDDLNSPYPDCENVHLFNCTADNNYRNGCSVIGCQKGSIIGGRYANSNGTAPQDGIDIEPNPDNGSGSPSQVSNFIVQNVHAYNNTNVGIEVYGAGTVQYVDLIGNHCYSNTQSGIKYRNATRGSIESNSCYSNSSQGIDISSVTNVDVSGNLCSGNTVNGIIVQNPNNETTANFAIDGNIVTGNTESGIFVTGLTYEIQNVVISNNNINANGQFGVYLLDTTDVRVDSNIIIGNSQTTDNTSDNIFAQSSDYPNITNNTIRHGGGAKQPRYGINIESASTQAVIGNNDVTNSGKTGALNIVPTNCDVYGPQQNNVSAAFQVISTTKGIGLPILTTAQKNSMPTPADGLIIFDTDINKICIYTGSAWETVTST